LRPEALEGKSEEMEDEPGIYRGEVIAIMGAIADLNVKVDRILDYIEGGDDEEEEEKGD